MEQRSVFLRGIAGVLNAGGSALLDIYDTATSMMVRLVPGEKEKPKAQLREYEKKIEELYYEIGKEVALRESAQTSAATEAKIKLVSDYRVKIEEIKQSLREIEEKERAAAKAATDGARVKAEPAEHAGADAASDVGAATAIPAGVAAEEGKENAEAAEAREAIAAGPTQSAEPEAGQVAAVAQLKEMTAISGEAETPPQELLPETAGSGVPIAGESSPGPEMKQEAVPEELDTMLKGELLKICTDRGIDADQRMTKAAIIELIKKKRIR
jgi:hypothetical protein